MPHLYLDRRKKPPVWRYQIWDARRRRRTFTGTASKAETHALAVRRQAFEKEIRQGLRKAPRPSDQPRAFEDVVDEHLAWGETQGGRGGRPWSPGHARMRRSRLAWWKSRLNLQAMSDLNGSLPRAEKALRGLLRNGIAGKTCMNYAEALHAFCRWSKDRAYLENDPLEGLAPFDTTPQTTRRAMTAQEIRKLLDACAPHRRLLYETAFATGLRAGELRALRTSHLDIQRGGLILDAAWTKNRKPGFQPTPRWLAEKLARSAEEGQAAKLYAELPNAWKRKAKVPDSPLLYVPSHTSREIRKDLKTAGIPSKRPEGKVDFHACRVAFVTFLVESGADIKTAQTLARHSTPTLTLNIYARARRERLVDAAEKVGQSIHGENGIPTADELSKRTNTIQQPSKDAPVTKTA